MSMIMFTVLECYEKYWGQRANTEINQLLMCTD